MLLPPSCCALRCPTAYGVGIGCRGLWGMRISHGWQDKMGPSVSEAAALGNTSGLVEERIRTSEISGPSCRASDLKSVARKPYNSVEARPRQLFFFLLARICSYPASLAAPFSVSTQLFALRCGSVVALAVSPKNGVALQFVRVRPFRFVYPFLMKFTRRGRRPTKIRPPRSEWLVLGRPDELTLQADASVVPRHLPRGSVAQCPARVTRIRRRLARADVVQPRPAEALGEKGSWEKRSTDKQPGRHEARSARAHAHTHTCPCILVVR